MLGFLSDLKDFFSDIGDAISENFDNLSSVIKDITASYSVCKLSKLKFSSSGENIIPIAQTSLDLAISSNTRFGNAFTSDAAVAYKAKLESILDSDSGYDPSCMSIPTAFQSFFSDENHAITGFKTKATAQTSASNYWYLCELNSAKTALVCSCKSGDCSQISSETSISFTINAGLSLNTASFGLWSVSGNFSYFAEYSTSETVSETVYSEKKFEFGSGSTNSTVAICEQIVGCMEITINDYKLLSSKEGCQGKMSEKCSDKMKEFFDKSGNNNIVKLALAASYIPYIDLENPSDEFISAQSAFLLSVDAFHLQSNIFTTFSVGLGEGMKNSNKRLLQSSFSNTLESDSGAQVDSSSYDDSEVNVDGSTSSSTANRSTYSSEVDTSAQAYVDGKYGGSSFIQLSFAIVLILASLF